MSKTKAERHTLGSRQKSVIRCLTQKGAQTINEAKKNMKADYKSTNQAFHSLENRGLIQKVSVKEYNKQEFPQFWLTSEGVLMALMDEKVDLNRLIWNIELLKGKDLASVKPFIGFFKCAPQPLRVMLKDVLSPLFKKYDLDRKLSDDEMQAFQKFIAASSPEFQTLFDAFLKLRSKVNPKLKKNQ